MGPADLIDAHVVSARFDPGARELVVGLEGGRRLCYRRVGAIGVTLGARIAAAEWVADTLPQTIFSEHVGNLARAESARGMAWLFGDAAGFERAAVRDGLSFTGGRWFRVFVGAGGIEVEAPT